MTVPDQPADRPARMLYSAEEAAELLGIGRTFLFQLLATGEIDSVKIGRRRKITRDALDRYIAGLSGSQPGEANAPRGAVPQTRQRRRSA